MTNFEEGCKAEELFIRQFGGTILDTSDERQYKQDIDVVCNVKGRGEITVSVKDIKASKQFGSIALELWQADEHKEKWFFGCYLKSKASHYAMKVWHEDKWQWCVCTSKQLSDLVCSKEWKKWYLKEATVQYNKSIGVKFPYTSGIVIPISALVEHKFYFKEVLL